ncbi:MAG: hypothetical protein EBU76_12140, partial [Gammaproteobacteria bacterium]|nr:hypothetical protein [Gammaproteobacteria bacterium]
GIDRSLARLLLSETTNDSVVTEPGVAETDVAPIDSSGNDADLERPTVESMVIAIPPMLLPPRVLPPSAPPVSVVDDAVARTVHEDAVSAVSITPIADEDLLRWRAFGFRGVTETTTSGQSPSTETPSIETPSTLSPADETATLPTGVKLKKDLGMGRLLTLTTPTRSADVLVGPIDASVSATAQAASPLNITTAPTLMTADESKTRENTRATTTVSELRSRAFNVSDVETADREPDAFAQEGETPSDGDRWETPSLVSALAPRSLDALIEMSSATDPLAGAAVIRPEAMAELPSRFRDLTSASTTHLPLPDPKMTAEDRSRTFAEAVAQRVIGQIRSENWSVSLQLEPLNMGSMDIDLSL